jgi:hypothetical protein
MKKLFDWLQLYVLSSEDWKKYGYVLHVIDSLREDYKIIESRVN